MDELERKKIEFMATLSHELRTPLASIHEAVSLVLDHIAGEINPKQEELLTLAQKEIKRLAEFISDILDISQITSGKAEFKKERLNLKQITHDAVNSIKPHADKKGVELEVLVKEDLVLVLADPHKISRVFINLLWNAIKFTPAGGRVKIIAESNGDNVHVKIEDNGMGIAKEQHEEIFNKFFQVDQSLLSGPKGVGLGLAIVKEIVERHDGKIWVESNLDKGSCFTFTLPKA